MIRSHSVEGEASRIDERYLLLVVVDSVEDGIFNLNGRASDERSIEVERRSLRKYVAKVVRRSRDGCCCR